MVFRCQEHLDHAVRVCRVFDVYGQPFDFFFWVGEKKMFPNGGGVIDVDMDDEW